MNVRFEYLYRDAHNYKNWGEIVFSNRNNHSVEDLEKLARAVLIDQEFFVADIANVPDLHFDHYIREVDHDWHAFDSFESTTEPLTDPECRDVKQFIECLERASDMMVIWGSGQGHHLS